MTQESLTGVAWLAAGASVLAVLGSGGWPTELLLPYMQPLALLGGGMLLLGYHRLEPVLR